MSENEIEDIKARLRQATEDDLTPEAVADLIVPMMHSVSWGKIKHEVVTSSEWKQFSLKYAKYVIPDLDNDRDREAVGRFMAREKELMREL